MTTVNPNPTHQAAAAKLDVLVRAHLTANPDADGHDVYAAIRAAGYEGMLQTFQVHAACERVRPAPTLSTVADASALMEKLAGRYEFVSVFWDRGWGDHPNPAEISIIVDGDGQMPMAWLTPEVYSALLARGVVGPNSLRTFKARRVHDFKERQEL